MKVKSVNDKRRTLKKTWSPPELVGHGTISQVTQKSGAFMDEGGPAFPNKKNDTLG